MGPVGCAVITGTVDVAPVGQTWTSDCVSVCEGLVGHTTWDGVPPISVAFVVCGGGMVVVGGSVVFSVGQTAADCFFVVQLLPVGHTTMEGGLVAALPVGHTTGFGVGLVVGEGMSGRVVVVSSGAIVGCGKWFG